MLKKILINIFILIFAMSASYAGDPLNIEDISDKVKSEAEEQIAPVIDIMSACLNAGIFSSVCGNFFSFGVQVNASQLKKEGLLEDVDLPGIGLPFAYIGGRIPGIGFKYINIFARGMVFPYKGKKVKIIGMGVGWEPGFVPLISFKLIIQYHFLQDFPYIEVNSLGGTIFGSLSFIPLITPFAFIGLNNTGISTPGIKILNETVDFSSDKIIFHLGAGLNLFKILTLEIGFLPVISGSLGVGFSF